MLLATFAAEGGGARVGAIVEQGKAQVVVDLSRPMFELGATRMEDVLDLDGPVLPSLRQLVDAADWSGLEVHPVDSVAFLPPISRPLQMPFVRANYPGPDGVKPDVERPAFFSKLPSTLIGQDETILLPEMSEQVDWEAELAFVIGRRASHVSRDDALDHIVAYTITNDITARDIQAMGEPALAKNFRTFAPLGPWLVTADEITDPHDLQIRQWINEELFQDGNTRDMVFDIPEIIAFLSSVTDLHPGDVVATGSPAGTGKQQQPPVFLRAGDTLRIEIPGIGTLRNRVA